MGYENPIHELSGCGTDRTNTTSKSISKGSLDVFGTERSLHQRDKDLIGPNLESYSGEKIACVPIRAKQRLSKIQCFELKAY